MYAANPRYTHVYMNRVLLFPRSLLSPELSVILDASATHLGKMTKTHQKLYKKIRKIDWSLLCLQQFDKFRICSAYRSKTRKDVKTAEIGLESS